MVARTEMQGDGIKNDKKIDGAVAPADMEGYCMNRSEIQNDHKKENVVFAPTNMQGDGINRSETYKDNKRDKVAVALTNMEGDGINRSETYKDNKRDKAAVALTNMEGDGINRNATKHSNHKKVSAAVSPRIMKGDGINRDATHSAAKKGAATVTSRNMVADGTKINATHNSPKENKAAVAPTGMADYSFNRDETHDNQQKNNATMVSTDTTGEVHSTAKEAFQPYQTLSKFIDSLPIITYPHLEPVPDLVGRAPEYLQLAQTVAQVIEVHPYRFVNPLKFFWNDDISLASIGGRELMAGDGRFGSVFLGYNEECELFALKYYKPEGRRNGELQNVINEAALQDKLAQRNVAPPVEGFGFIGDTNSFHRLVLVSKFIAAKPDCLKPLTLGALCLEDAARRRNGYPPLLLSHQYMNLLVRISTHQARLAQCQVIHTDIKCDNVLLKISEDGKELKPYLIDFGSSFIRKDSNGPRYRIGSREESENFLRRYPHFAPEFLYDPNAVSTKSDLYGVGLILRGIGNYLEIPALVCIASKLRLRNPASRPSCSILSQLIRVAFGKRPLRQYLRRQPRQAIQCGGWSNNLLATYKFANFHIDNPVSEPKPFGVNSKESRCVALQNDGTVDHDREQASAEETGKWTGLWVRQWDITAWLQSILATLCGLKIRS